MKAVIAGVGAFGPGFADADELSALFDGAVPVEAESATTAVARPPATVIPPRERRRAPLSVKLAVEVAGQACAAAGVEPADAACVFASALGDLEITDYMCRTLASDAPQLSPTKFHNSVHNAPVGYWSISTGNHQAGNAVAGGPDGTIAASLLEALVQCQVEQRPVLWACQDIAAPDAYRALWPVDSACAFALLLRPAGDGESASSATLVEGATTWPALHHATLAALYSTNPSARTLALLAAHHAGEAVTLPLNSALSLRVTP